MAYYNQNYHNPDRKVNRVYINPNFNRQDTIPSSSSSSMYFNPNFSHVTPHLNHHLSRQEYVTLNLYHHNRQEHVTSNLNHHHNRQDHVTPNLYHNRQEPKDQASKTKIHVNPNFIRNANAYNPIVAKNPEPYVTKPPSIPSSSINYSTSKELKQNAKNGQAPSMHVAKSRYSLVRQKENVLTKTPISRPVTTVKVNKYKSVSINVVKNNLATVNPIKNTLEASYKTCFEPIEAHINNTRFKFFKSNSATVFNQTETKQVAPKRSSIINKSILKTEFRKMNNKFVLKKNNIPCPLFKKYGKCLRKVRGNCVYLHDEKHVSICRKFLKGICHDEDCLLSHDLTDKKMPTCYFYLQGACTKESCPYLHVKLNEKTKICQDFLRGYCEKGDKCLFRHISACQDMASKKCCLKKHLTASKTNSVVKVKSRKKSLVMLSQEHRNARKKLEGITKAKDIAKEQRYFKELVEDKSSGEMCDMIKPSRIKLGTLPSFIQL